MGFPKFAGPQDRVAFKSALKVDPFCFADTSAGDADTTFPILPAAPKIGLTKEESFRAEFPILLEKNTDRG